MIEVRIRHMDEATAVRLCDWDPTDLDGVIRMLCAEGVRTGNGDQFAAEDSFQSEIVLEDGAAFYEVVLMDSEEA